MPITVEMKFDGLTALIGLMDDRPALIVEETLEAIKADAQNRILTGDKTGRIYTSGPQPLPHQASAPGESPANWTGELAENIETEMLDIGPGFATGEVRFNSDHAAPLEFGTSKMAARPFVAPAVAEAAPGFYERMAGVALPEGAMPAGIPVTLEDEDGETSQIASIRTGA